MCLLYELLRKNFRRDDCTVGGIFWKAKGRKGRWNLCRNSGANSGRGKWDKRKEEGGQVGPTNRSRGRFCKPRERVLLVELNRRKKEALMQLPFSVKTDRISLRINFLIGRVFLYNSLLTTNISEFTNNILKVLNYFLSFYNKRPFSGNLGKPIKTSTQSIKIKSLFSNKYRDSAVSEY